MDCRGKKDWIAKGTWNKTTIGNERTSNARLTTIGQPYGKFNVRPTPLPLMGQWNVRILYGPGATAHGWLERWRDKRNRGKPITIWLCTVEKDTKKPY